MSRRSWFILVLVCVVALVAIAGVAYQSNAEKSVEEAVRYYADAVSYTHLTLPTILLV